MSFKPGARGERERNSPFICIHLHFLNSQGGLTALELSELEKWPYGSHAPGEVDGQRLEVCWGWRFPSFPSLLSLPPALPPSPPQAKGGVLNNNRLKNSIWWWQMSPVHAHTHTHTQQMLSRRHGVKQQKSHFIIENYNIVKINWREMVERVEGT